MLFEPAWTDGALQIASDTQRAIRESDVTVICVGTPAAPNGELSLTQVDQAVREIGDALETKRGYHLVILRSTVIPGATRERVDQVLQARTQCDAKELGIVFQPQFLREGSAVSDFLVPPMQVFGAATFTPKTMKQLKALYRGIEGTMYFLSLESAEMLKLACNAFHALKVTFANEIGALCRANGLESDVVLDMLARDCKLNVSGAYLKPGFAYGGPCLPKDLAALTQYDGSLDLPLLRSISASNAAHIERAVKAIKDIDARRVGIVGLAHKRGTKDWRNSAAVQLLYRLKALGFWVAAYDEAITPRENGFCVGSLTTLIEASDTLVLVGWRYAEIAPLAGERPIIELTAGSDGGSAIRIA
jgi:GDP-mannose 6-dehydrogenase